MATARKSGAAKTARKTAAKSAEPAARKTTARKTASDAAPRGAVPGVAGAQPRVKEEMVRATLNSTYAGRDGKNYGPGRDILVPKSIADVHNVTLPASAEGWDEESMHRNDSEFAGAQETAPQPPVREVQRGGRIAQQGHQGTEAGARTSSRSAASRSSGAAPSTDAGTDPRGGEAKGGESLPPLGTTGQA